MKNIYLVDSENVSDSWLQLLDQITSEDQILVFYTDRSPHMSYANLIHLKQSEFQPEFLYCRNGTDNALDFQLVSYLGFLLKDCADANLTIVSKDKGFDCIVQFWTERGFQVSRLHPNTISREAKEPQKEKYMGKRPTFHTAKYPSKTVVSGNPRRQAKPSSPNVMTIESPEKEENFDIIPKPLQTPIEPVIEQGTEQTGEQRESTMIEPDFQKNPPMEQESIPSENLPTEESTPQTSEEHSSIEYDEGELTTLISCIGQTDLASLHNIFVSVYGMEKGSFLYNMVKKSPHERKRVNWQKKTRYKKFLIILFANSNITLHEDFIKKLYDQKENLKDVHNLFVSIFGQKKGSEYYKIYKPLAEFLKNTF